MRLFKDTPHVLGNEQPRFKNMKKPCLISFDIFRPPFCDGLIKDLLSIRLSLSTKDAQKICSNTFFTFKPYNPSNQGVGQQPLHLQQRPRLPPTTLKNTVNVSFFPRDDFTCKRKFSIVPDVFKLTDSDNENVRDLNANECLKDGLKSK